jgi:RNA polymerase sigma factor (sigma-70 family)
MRNSVANKTRCEPDGVLWALGRLAQKKDTQAWSVLVAQVGPDVQRLAMRMTGDYALAEDIVQETFLLVRDYADRFVIRDGDGDDHARRWIMGVATNASLLVARRHLRQLHRDARAGRAAAQTATPVISPAQQAEDADENRLLRRELTELPTVYGQALTLHYFAGQDYPELASHLRVSVNTVRSRVHRGLKALRERLDRCGVALSIAALTGLLSNLGAATTVGGAATVSASTLGLISSMAVPTTSFLVASGGMTMATVLASVFAALFAVVVFSGVYLSSFKAESAPPQKVEVVEVARTAGTAGAAEVVNNAPVMPFILVVKTDQMDERTVSVTVKEVTDRAKKKISGGPFLTSGPDQFRLPLHLFAHYDFTIKWGDGTTQVVRSDAPADLAIIDEAWLAQVTKGLEQPLTLDFDHIPTKFEFRDHIDEGEKEYRIARGLRYLLKNAGMDLCGQIFIDPKVSTSGLNKVQGLRVEAMKLGEIFERLTMVTGLTCLLHDRALVISERKNLPIFMCPQHTYAQPGTYAIEITENVKGGFPQIYFNRGYDGVKVMDLAQWGGNTWTSLNAAFAGCANMTMSASDAATAVTGAVREFSKAWLDCCSVTSFPLLNTSGGTNFVAAWYGCFGLTTFPWLDTAAGTNFRCGWVDCSGLTSFPLLNTSAGTNFSFAWSGCSGLTSFPLLDTSAGTDFECAWGRCSGLTSFPLLSTSAGTNFIRAWFCCSGLTSFPLLDASAGTDFEYAWDCCSGLTSFPLLNTSAGTDFSSAWGSCKGLTSFPLLNTHAGKNFSSAWSYCSGLTSFPLLNTSAGTDFSTTWSYCSGLTSFPLLDTSAGTNFTYAWSYCSGLTSFPLLDISAGTDFMDAWFKCSSLTNFPLLDTSAGTNFIRAWFLCTGLTNFPLLNTSAGTYFSSAWGFCSGLTSFPLLDTSAGKNFDGAWSGCSSLTSFPLLNTSAGTSFHVTWSGCSSLTNFPLLDTSAGTYFSGAWENCSGLTSFPLLNTSAGESFGDKRSAGAWSGCSGLNSFPLLNFGNMDRGKKCFSGVTLTSDSYGELLANIAALSKFSNVEFDGGLSKTQSLIGVQAREKLTKKMGWSIADGDDLNPKPPLKEARPAEILPQPQPEEANSF